MKVPEKIVTRAKFVLGVLAVMAGFHFVVGVWDVVETQMTFQTAYLRDGLHYVWAISNPNGIYGPTECRLIEPSEDLDTFPLIRGKGHKTHEAMDDFPEFRYRTISVPYHQLVVVVNDYDRKEGWDRLLTVQFIGGPYCGRWGQIARSKLQ